MIVPSHILDFDRKTVIVPSQILTGCPGPARAVTRFLARPVVPLSWDNEGTSVPVSQKVALSLPVGNPLSKEIISDYRFVHYFI